MAEQIGLEGVFDMQKFDQGITNYLRGLADVDSKTSKVGNSFGAAFDTMGSKVLNASAALSKTFVVAAGAAAVAVGAFVAGGINKASDLESKMGGIASIMGETKDAIEPLKDLILDLGMDPNLKVDATEAADAIEKLASNGLTMTQIMDGAAKSTVLLANSTGADFDTAAAVATDSMALFNIEAGNMQEAVNGITGVTVASKFDINDYRLALSQAGGVAAATGVEFDDFNASISGISNYFASGSDAGTSFKTMLLRMNPQTDEAASAMKALGLEFFDANGNMKSMAEVSTELNDAFAKEITTTSTVSNLTDEQTARKKKLEQTIRGLTGKLADYQSGIAGVSQSENDKAVSVDRLNRQLAAAQAEYAGLASIQGTTTSTTRKLTEEEKTHYLSVIFGTDAMRAAVAMSEQGEVAYTDLNVAAKELGVGIDELTQYADGGITKFEAMLVTIGKTDAVESAKVRMDNFKGSMEILQGVIDTVGLQIGFAFLPMLKTLADNVAAFASDHSAGMILFFENLAAAIEAFVSGAPGDFPWEDILPPGLANTMYTVSQIVEGLGVALTDFNTGAMGLDYPWEDIFPGWLATIIYTVVENFDALTGALGGIAALLASAGIAAAISAIGAAMAVVLSPMGLLIIGSAALGAAWNTNFLGLRDTTLAVLTAVQEAFLPLTTALSEFGTGALAEIIAFATGNETQFTAVKAIWDGAVESISGMFTGLVTAVTTNLPTWQTNLAAFGTAALTWITEAAAQAATKIGEFVTSLASSLMANLPLWAASVAPMAAGLIAWITGAITTGVEELGKWGTALTSWIVDTGVPNLVASTTQLAGALIGWVTTDLIPKVGPAMLSFGASLGTGVLAVATAMGVVATAIGTSIKNAITSTDWAAVGNTILTTIKTGWETAKATVLPVFGALVTSIKTKFSETNWSQVGTDIATLIKTGFKTAAEGAAGVVVAAGAVATSIKNAFTDMTWSEIGQTIIDGIKAGLKLAADAAGGLVAQAGTLATSLGNKILETDWNQVGHNIAIAIKDGLRAAVDAVGGLVETAGTIVTDVLAKFTGGDWSGTGTSIMTLLGTAVEGAAKLAGGLLYAVGNIAIGMLEEFTGLDFTTAGTTLMNALRDAIYTAASSGEGLLAKVGTIATDTLAKFTSVDWLGTGTKVIEDIKTGVSTAATTFLTYVSTVATDTLAKFTDIEWVSIGTAIIDGIKKGITDSKDKLTGYVTTFLKDILPDFAEQALGIQSPSKVFAEIGRNIVLGLIVGVQDTADELQQVMGRLFAGLTSTEVGNLDINVTDQFAQRADDIINPLQEQLAAMETINELEHTRLDLMHQIGVAYEGATEEAGLDEKVLEDIAKWSEELDTVNQSIATRLKLQRDLDALQGLSATVQELRAQQESISLFEDYLGLMTQASDLGINIDRFNTIPDSSLSMLQSMIALEGDIARVRQEQLRIQAVGLRQSIAEQRVLKERATWYQNALKWIEPLIKANETNTFFGKQYTGAVLTPLLTKLEQVAEVESERSRLLAEYASMSGALQQSNAFQKEAELLEQRVNLLQQAAELGIDISKYGVDYDRSVAGLTQMVDLEKQIALARIGQLQRQGNELKLSQLQAAEEQKRLKGFELAMRQLEWAIKKSEQVASAFAQHMKAQMLDPIIEKLKTAAGIESERVALVLEYRNIALQLERVQFFETGNARMEDYLKLLQEAQGLGIDISGMPLYSDNPADLTRIVALEEQVLKARRSQLLQQTWQLQQQTAEWQRQIQLQKQMKPLQDYVNSMEKGNDHLSEQLSLMQRAEDMGMNLLDVWNSYVTFDPNDLQRRLEFQKVLAEASKQDLLNQMTTMIAEQKRVKGLEAALTQLQPLIDQTNVSSAWGQRYKATVLDPLLRALEKAAGIDSERVRLMGEYTAAAQKLAEIQRKEEQLNFLKQQLDMVNMIRDQDIVGGDSLFGGIAFGVNASIDDLLTLTTRVLNALVTETKDELGIHSPSSVFADIGSQMMAGLAQGVRSNFLQPLNALRESTLSHGAVSARTLNFAMGGVNINNGMDEVMFERRVMRVIERAW